MSDKIPVGISQCLMGEKVRHDGSHKRDSYATKTLANYFDLVGFCPEMAAGLGVPREPIRLLMADKSAPEDITIVATKDHSRDVTESIVAASAEKVKTASEEFCGYILMKASPSCGMERVKVYNDAGNVQHNSGVGLFAKGLIENNPWLPIEESGRLHDPLLRENFVTHVFALSDFKCRLGANPKYSDILNFYSEYKYMVMAHSIKSYKEIGRYLAGASSKPIDEVIQSFGDQFFSALATLPSRKKHTNVLMHLRGYLKKDMSPAQTQGLSEIIEHYRIGAVPLSVPLLMLKQLSIEVSNDYLKSQKYWQPFPDELGLRNY